MSSFYPPKLEPRHPTTTLAGDVPCRKCHGNLRGLSCDAHCPACGAAVSLSLRGDLIRYSNPAWINRVRVGLTFSIYGTIIVFLGLAGVFADFAYPYINRSATEPLINLLIPLAVLLAGLLMEVLGTFLMTAPDPCVTGEKRYGRVRKSIRVFLLLGIVITGLLSCADARVLPMKYVRFIPITRASDRIIGIVSTMLVLNYLSKLSLRIRDTTLADRARFLSFTIGISSTIFAACEFTIDPAYRISQFVNGDILDLLMYVYFLAALVAVIFLVSSIVLMEKFARRLKQQAALARQEWETPVTPPSPPLSPG